MQSSAYLRSAIAATAIVAALALAPAASAAQTPDQILSDLAARQTHSWIDNDIGLPGMMNRYKTGEHLYVTCGYVSEIARQLLTEAGYIARRVGTITLDTPNNETDGHAMIEVYYQSHWQLYDVDANAKAVDAAGNPVQLVQQIAAVQQGTAHWQTIATDALYREDEPDPAMLDVARRVFTDPDAFYRRVMGFALLPRDKAGTGGTGMYYVDSGQIDRIAKYWPDRYYLATPTTWYNLTGIGTKPVTAPAPSVPQVVAPKPASTSSPTLATASVHVKPQRSCRKLRRAYRRTHTRRAHRRYLRCLHAISRG